MLAMCVGARAVLARSRLSRRLSCPVLCTLLVVCATCQVICSSMGAACAATSWPEHTSVRMHSADVLTMPPLHCVQAAQLHSCAGRGSTPGSTRSSSSSSSPR
jgi:hypothetical protein